ncbi:histidinol-phosphate transaminase [candidate division KSB1 bacterium]|nr:histidinol-phosphate transaminase [candidate division KSB1 bacterium]
MRNLKQVLTQLETYSVPQYKNIIKLNQNESPYDVPEFLKKEIQAELELADWNRYADLRPKALIHAISEYTDHPPEGIIPGNGSNEMIQTLMNAFCYSSDSILVVSPGFSVYPRLAKVMGLEIIEVPLLEDFSFDVPAIIEKSAGVQLLFLAVPNAPTGTILTVDQIRQIAEKIDGVLIVDEAYYEFYGETAQSLIREYDNLVVIRTFSKAFSLAGLRLGYMLAPPDAAIHLDKAKLPFSVGVFQQIGGEVLMRNFHYIQKIASEIIEERERLLGEMRALSGINFVPSKTNFVLFEIKHMTASEVYQAFFEHGVLIRVFKGGRLDSYVRVTVGSPEENNVFLEKLKQIAGK